jgi:hypothetical protein
MGPNFGKVCFPTLLLSIVIIGNSKNYYDFPTDIDKYSFVSTGKMPSKREIYLGAKFFCRSGRKSLPRVVNTGEGMLVS